MEGTKELVLFPPSDLPLLYYTPRAKGTLRYAWPNTFTRLPISEVRRARSAWPYFGWVVAARLSVDRERHPNSLRVESGSLLSPAATPCVTSPHQPSSALINPHQLSSALISISLQSLRC